jgi:hypothetical protein
MSLERGEKDSTTLVDNRQSGKSLRLAKVHQRGLTEHIVIVAIEHRQITLPSFLITRTGNRRVGSDIFQSHRKTKKKRHRGRCKQTTTKHGGGESNRFFFGQLNTSFYSSYDGDALVRTSSKLHSL